MSTPGLVDGAVLEPGDRGGRVVACRRGAHGMAELRASFRSDARAPEANMVLSGLLVDAQTTARLRGWGAEASVVIDVDRMLLSVVAPVTAVEPVLRLVAERLAAPELVAAQVEQECRRLGAILQMSADDPAMRADLTANRARYGAHHPYGREPDPAVLAGLSAEKVVQVAVDTCGRGGADIAIAGDADPRALAAAVRSSGLGAGPGAGLPLVPDPPPPTAVRRVVGRPGARGASMRVVCPAPTPGSADLSAMDVVATMIGGSTTSLLFARLREQLGLSYRVRARVVHAAVSSALVMSASSSAERGAQVLDEMDRALDGLVSAPPHVEALRHAVNYVAGSHRITVSTPAGLADSLLAGWRADDDPRDVVDGRERELRRVTPESVLEVARSFLGPDGRVLVQAS